MSHSVAYRVYYEDTDAGGIVYHANYLKFCERGRTEWLRELGFECSQLEKEHSILIVVRRIEADYLATAHLDEMLTVQSNVLSKKNTSFILKQSIYRDDTLIFDAKVVLVFIDNAGKPVRIPKSVAQKL